MTTDPTTAELARLDLERADLRAELAAARAECARLRGLLDDRTTSGVGCEGIVHTSPSNAQCIACGRYGQTCDRTRNVPR